MADYGAIAGNILATVVKLKADRDAGKLTDAQLQMQLDQLAKLDAIPLPQLQKIVATQLGPSAVAGIQRDEGLRSEQLQVLGALQDIIDSGGLTTSDKVALEGINSDVDSADRRRRAGINADMQRRGQLNSGAALVSDNMSAQDAANRARQSGQETAGRAEDRVLEALKGIEGAAGRVRSQDFSEAERKAQAADMAEQWNAGAKEKANYANANIPQQQFQNELSKTSARGNAVNGIANTYGQQAEGLRDRAAGTAGAVANTVKGATTNNPYSDGLRNDGLTYSADPSNISAVATSNPYPQQQSDPNEWAQWGTEDDK